MIEDSLLFQMGYIFPDITPVDVGLSFVFFLSLLLFFILRSKMLARGQRPTLPPIPKIDDSHFEERLAEYIRAKFATIYIPLRSRAHTAREIAHYAGDHPYLTILKQLEEVEYTSKRLSEEERRDILTILSKSKKR